MLNDAGSGLVRRHRPTDPSRISSPLPGREVVFRTPPSPVTSTVTAAAASVAEEAWRLVLLVLLVLLRMAPNGALLGMSEVAGPTSTAVRVAMTSKRTILL